MMVPDKTTRKRIQKRIGKGRKDTLLVTMKKDYF